MKTKEKTMPFSHAYGKKIGLFMIIPFFHITTSEYEKKIDTIQERNALFPEGKQES